MIKKTESTSPIQIYTKLLLQCSETKFQCITGEASQILNLLQALHLQVQHFLQMLQEQNYDQRFTIKLLVNQITEISNLHNLRKNENAKAILLSCHDALQNYCKSLMLKKPSPTEMLISFVKTLGFHKLLLYDLNQSYPGLCLLTLFLDQLKDKENYCFTKPQTGTTQQLSASFSVINDVYEELGTYKNKILLKDKNNTYPNLFSFFEKTILDLKNNGYLAENKTPIDIVKTDFPTDDIFELDANDPGFDFLENPKPFNK